MLPADSPAFYLPDFSLRDQKPWFVFESTEEIERSVLSPGPSDSVLAPFTWSAGEQGEVRTLLESAMHTLSDRGWQKLVPVWFEHAHQRIDSSLFASMMHRVLAAPSPLIPYALSDGDEGLIGATPEVLFTINQDGSVHTAAVAGTRRRELDESGAELLRSEKDRREHEYVRSFILERLEAFGAVESDETRVAVLPRLVHLETPIWLRPREPVSFEALVRALHPTPALGAVPQREGVQWLAEHISPELRRRYGAPFGYRRADGSGVCVVAIRNIQWCGADIVLGAGCGIVAGSNPDHELDELRAKSQSVHSLLGI